ncbi:MULTISPECIES: ParM/StbA family protein [Acidithiobacillus]|uniref:ParM/StbA family protein n=1 Tax=Acidithiobacillus TaxID=119977 RepID=UPI0009DAB923|nr:MULTISPECIES: ParM/StbA family protein [Acidithiobacillus]MDD2751347.1 ParM/StbA family protein [Acidithiobacillus sp.]MDD5280701.1 ParM/StbA family protein [Acidithiobacillus sp.]
MAFVTGMDIGYGNLKIAFGEALDPAPVCEIYPACAVPAELVATSLFGADTENETGIRVQVHGKSWMAGVPGDAVQRHAPRQLHEGYVGSDAWTALAYAGILMTGQTVIDRLVVGLPVQHYEDPERRQALKEILQGVHAVLPKRSIEVRQVQVVPQPVGAYVDAINGNWCPEPVQERLAEETSLVVDPGFFSLDWTLVRAGGRYAALASGSSLFAVSQVLSEARKIIADTYGKAPTVAQLENCLQNGREHLYIFNQDVVLPPVFEQAAQMVGREALSEMRGMLRQVDDPINFIILAGGGARLYTPMAQEVYPDSQILMADHPELANAQGFWHLGAQSFV